MMFAGFSGTTTFRPELVATDSYVPLLVFTDFRVPGSPVHNARSLRREVISGGETITLAHAQNLFSLTFAALSYSSPTSRRYRYMLDDLDS